MALTQTKILIARSSTPGKVPTNAQLIDGQLAVNIADMKLYTRNSAGVVTLLADGAASALALTAVQEINGVTPVGGVVTLNPGDIGEFGVAPLDVNGKVPTAYLPEAAIGAVTYQGTYDAATNTPALPEAAESKGFYYVVTVAGTQEGLTLGVGDWVISNGEIWQKVDALDAVQSVNGQTGTVVLTAASVGAVAISNGEVQGNIEFVDNITFTNPVVVPTATIGTQAVNLDQVNALIADGGVVASVNGQTGVVVLTADNVGALPVTAPGTVGVATTFTQPVVVPTAVTATQAVNLGQVETLIEDAVGATGTVTSVGLAAPAELFEITNSPVTESGTLTLALTVQDPNTVFAGPSDGSPAAPTFRLLTQDDMPAELVLDEGEY